MTCVLPPLTYSTTGSAAPVATRPISMCATQWFTGTSGTPHIRDNALALTAQDLRGAPMPGPEHKQRDEREGESSKASATGAACPGLKGEPTFCVTYTSDVLARDAGLLQREPHQPHHVLLMVPRGLSGQEAMPWRGDEGLARVGEDGIGPICSVVANNPNPHLVTSTYDASALHQDISIYAKHHALLQREGKRMLAS